MNPLRDAAVRGNKDRERALARRVEVWRRHSTGELYLVDVNTMRCVGAVAGDQIRSRLTQARSSRVDEFLELHWAFDTMAPHHGSAALARPGARVDARRRRRASLTTIFDESAIERLVQGLPAIDAPSFNEGQDAVDAHLRRLLAELRDCGGVDVVVEPREHGGTATFVEAFAWPSDGSTIRRLERSPAQRLREAPVDIVEGLTLLLSRLAPCAFIGSQTLPRVDDRIRFAAPIGLATAEWIRQPPPAALAGLADRLRSDLACLGVEAPSPSDLLDPIPFQGPLDGLGSLMNIASPNRLFDALSRWCD